MGPGCVMSCSTVLFVGLVCLLSSTGAQGASLGGTRPDLSLLDQSDLSSIWFVHKRRPISINQDLMSISRMLGGGNSRSSVDRAQNFLASIGKRAGESLDGYMSDDQVDAAFQSEQNSDFERSRRAGQLSVGMPLRTLSGMLQAQRRRQFVDKANSAHSRLMGIGKRSVPDEHLDLGVDPELDTPLRPHSLS